MNKAVQHDEIEVVQRQILHLGSPVRSTPRLKQRERLSMSRAAAGRNLDVIAKLPQHP
jgi:hypothetical protein